MITVFTPTYNREYCIKNLYNSLKEQKYKDFEWLIIDDGSSDKTSDIIETFKNDNLIKIRYYKQENQGKYICINNGVDLAYGEAFFIVDSDDFLTEDALEKVNFWIEKLKLDPDYEKFIGVSGLRINHKNEIIGTKHDLKYVDATTLEYRYKYRIKGDKAEVFFTDKLKKYKFPILNREEKFQTEAIIFNKMGQDGERIRWYNEPIYYCEYLEDGLTMNLNKNKLKNWNGYIYYYNQIMKYDIPVIEKIRELSNYYRIGLTKYSIKYLKSCIHTKKYSLICIVLGYLYFKKDSLKDRL